MQKHYRNPVWAGELADPFVLRTTDGYYAYGTAPAGDDERIFPVLHSSDMVNWKHLGGALTPLRDPTGRLYWAPEVVEHQGRFYMYYSASLTASEAGHRLRVAVADHPAGPFKDLRQPLMDGQDFAIDPNPFHDPRDGRWYLFFATDYTADKPTGTGLAVVELAPDLTRVVGAPRIVVRACAEWQIYQRNRDYKGQVWAAWHCVEGPCVIHHDGRYYCLYSGGAWYTANYGVGFAVAEHPLGPWKDEFAAQGPTVLKGDGQSVIGPGHNSVVLGPDDQTLFIIYHAWDAARTARRMCIDPLIWTNAGPKADGPSTQQRIIFTRES